jgi:hypothetical protein
MFIALLVGLVLLAAGLDFPPASSVQQPDRPTVADASIASGSGNIRGRVADRDSNRPLSGAFVQLLSADLQRASLSKTAADGGFSFDAIAPGEYRLVVTHSGYVDQAYGAPDVRMARVTPEAIVVVDRDSVVRIDFRMVRAASILGFVFSEDGSPLEGAKVALTMITERGLRVSRWSVRRACAIL